MAKGWPKHKASEGQCPDCGGGGGKKIKVQRVDKKGKTFTEETWQDCGRCGGKGKIPT